jgi:hypothetical protein
MDGSNGDLNRARSGTEMQIRFYHGSGSGGIRLAGKQGSRKWVLQNVARWQSSV